MEKAVQEKQILTICFLPAENCRAEQLAGVYSRPEQPRQLDRIQQLLTGPSADRQFFVTAEYKGKTIALLHLCRDRRRKERFRIRGLATSKPFRRRGLATRMLQFGIDKIFGLQGGTEILSFILPGNSASIAAHKRAGFQPGILEQPQPQRHLCFILHRNTQHMLFRSRRLK